MNRADFENAAHRDGYAISETTIPANRPRDMHTHEFDARLYVLSGTLTIRYPDHADTFNPGEFCDVKAGLVHVEEAGAEGAHVVAARRYAASASAAE